MLMVTSRIAIPEKELEERFIHASGPGGQHVNKVATAVQLRFNVAQSPSLPDEVRRRLLKLAAGRINADGVLLIEASRFRSQDQNREAARKRLLELLRKAAKRPKRRIPTQPSAASEQRRLATKQQRAALKKQRRGNPRLDD